MLEHEHSDRAIFHLKLTEVLIELIRAGGYTRGLQFPGVVEPEVAHHVEGWAIDSWLDLEGEGVVVLVERPPLGVFGSTAGLLLDLDDRGCMTH